MSAEYVRRQYGVGYKRGDRITVDGEPGTIVSFPDQYLGVRLDAYPRRTTRCHPTWRVERIERGESVLPPSRDPQAWSVLAEGLDGEAGMKR